MSFACIYVPEFSVHACVRSIPECGEQAFAVLDGTPPLLAIIAANQKARELGIEIGMTKLQSETCPNLRLRRRSLAQEEAAHGALLDCMYAFSPRLEDTRAGDTVILDITGLERL